MSQCEQLYHAGVYQEILAGADFDSLQSLYSEYCDPVPVRITSAAPRTARFWVNHLNSTEDLIAPDRSTTALSETISDTDYLISGVGRPDQYVIRIPLGRNRMEIDGRDGIASSTIQSPDQPFRHRVAATARLRYLVLPPQRLIEALQVRLGEAPRGVLRFDPVIETRAPATAAWLSLINTFADPVHARLLAQSPLALRHFEQMLVHALLDTQPHAFSAALPRHHTAPPPSALRRAMTYCEEHAAEPISVADLAAAAGLSVRQLQRGFREYLGIGPLEYLRRVRLDQVHQELLAVAQGRAIGTVTEIATRWGFVHLGRFSEYYREIYGRPPSHTLRSVPA